MTAQTQMEKLAAGARVDQAVDLGPGAAATLYADPAEQSAEVLGSGCGTGRFCTTSWDEKLTGEPSGGSAPRVAYVHTTCAFDGVIKGTSVGDYVMYYAGSVPDAVDSEIESEDETGTYVGYEHVTGRIGGRAGRFVLRHAGEFTGSKVSGRWTVVSGSGTGELVGLSGVGGFTGMHGEEATPYTFAYSLPPAAREPQP